MPFSFKTGLLRHFIPRKDGVWPMTGGKIPPLRFVGIVGIVQPKDDGLLRHFIPRKDADVIGAQWWRQDAAATGLLPPRYVRGRIISFLAKTGYGQ